MNFSKYCIMFFLISCAFFSCDSGSSSSGSDSVGDAFGGAIKARPDSVGDIVFSDGTAVAYSENLVLSKEQKSRAVAVIFYKGTEKDALGEKMLGVGLKHDKAGRIWCDTSSKAYSKNVPSIACLPCRSEVGDYSFSGDLCGDDNLSQICESIGADDTYIGWRYPAFFFAIEYKDYFSSIKGTEYESGWYLPSVAELYQVWRNVSTVDAALSAAGGDSFSVDNYWSSSVDGVSESCASRLLFAYGTPDSSCKKYKERCVCAVRKF